MAEGLSISGTKQRSEDRVKADEHRCLALDMFLLILDVSKCRGFKNSSGVQFGVAQTNLAQDDTCSFPHDTYIH